MDNLLFHLGHMPRNCPAPCPVHTVGYLWKTDANFLCNQSFPSFNFSFILEGEGSYKVDDGERMEVRAPCVLTQEPGHLYTYGPTEGKPWLELFLIFPERTLPVWKGINLYDPGIKAWTIANTVAVETRIASLLQSLRQREGDGMADVIDRDCELLVVESRRLTPPRNPSPLHLRLHRLRNEIDAQPECSYDFPGLARACGCSYSTFRKDWKTLFGKPPGKYLADRRLQEARRLLVETEYSVGEIAGRLGFEDVLYFSRRFHLHVGQTASEYRRIHKPERIRAAAPGRWGGD